MEPVKGAKPNSWKDDKLKVRLVGYALIASILALGLVLSAAITTGGLVKIKSQDTTITVTGSAKKPITSDLIVWSGYFSATSFSTSEAYAQLKGNQEKVKNYFVDQGLKETDMVFSSINTTPIYEILPNGNYSNYVSAYQLGQSVTIRSSDVEKITELSRKATDLINEGVDFSSDPPQYIYTQIADLKVEMLSEATKDARLRAEQIAESAGSKVGELRFAKMGVIQITPLYSNEVSDYGMNDTSSIDKDITAVVTCQFAIK